MARKATALVASALLILLAVAFLSHDAGVEAWCMEYPASDTNACRAGRGFAGGECNKGECLCLKCGDDEPPPAARAL
ncbi:hypothetical protein BDA96_04G062200 [Sorghum bicolor]|uniref:Knottin scorpion toxin-like domain-containing protein n=1 Tax=Sorghum bicolor TaxID=4558 RepID=A0A921R2D1_SORBI|nr:hypothetical protein BDA96_04G062200 [Sorghum bicolor]